MYIPSNWFYLSAMQLSNVSIAITVFFRNVNVHYLYLPTHYLTKLCRAREYCLPVFIPVFLSHYAPRTLKKCILLKLSISWLLNSLEYNGVGRLVWNCSLPNHHSIRNINLSIHSFFIKLEKILKGSLHSIPSPSPSVKIQIMGRKVCFRCNGKTLLGVVTHQCFTLLPQVDFPGNNLNFHWRWRWLDQIQATF